MKTGRRRRKDPSQIEAEKTSGTPAGSAPSARPAPRAQAKARRRPSIVEIALVVAVVIIGVIAIVMLGRSCSRADAAVYLPATASGTWATTLEVLAPEVVRGQGWRTACDADTRCSIVAGSCELREREDRFSEREIENYDDYAYSIYYEELTQELYEAAGDEFIVTQLNPDEDRWEGDRHIVSDEWLDEETCEYTAYTVWVTDPDDTSQEVEVVLSECEVWDHVVVTQKVYDRAEYCQTETVLGMTVVDTVADGGSGSAINWPSALRPEGGEVQSSFRGEIVFRADGTEHRVTVTDPDAYVRYLTVPHYLGLDEEGRVVRVAARLPDE